MEDTKHGLTFEEQWEAAKDKLDSRDYSPEFYTKAAAIFAQSIREENKIELSNYAYEADRAKRDRNRAEEQVMKKDQEIERVNELLAIMHGDGGHHQQKVGTEQAIKDAIELLHIKWVTNEMLTDINAALKEIAELKEEVEDLKLTLAEYQP